MKIHGNCETAVAIDGDRTLLYVASISTAHDIGFSMCCGWSYYGYSFPLPEESIASLRAIGLDVERHDDRSCECLFCNETHDAMLLHDPQLMHLVQHPIPKLRIIDDSDWKHYRRLPYVEGILNRRMAEWKGEQQ